jgi:hypothetical protein
MRGGARFVILAAIVYLAVYIVFLAVYVPCFTVSVSRAAADQHLLWMLPFHFLAMLLNCVALLLTIRDLYLRRFPDENAKLTWLLLILLTGGVGWLIYIFKYALKPRPRTLAV